MKKEEKIYKCLQKRNPRKLALENEIFAIRDHNFPEVENCIYVNGYIGLDVIQENIEKQKTIEKLQKVIDLMAERMVIPPTKNAVIATLARQNLEEKKEVVKNYYFNKAKEESKNEKRKS